MHQVRFALTFAHFNPFQSSVAFDLETTHLHYIKNKRTGFYIKCNTGMKRVNVSIQCKNYKYYG